MTDSSLLTSSTSCLGRTCLKWSADGELTALDLSLVLQRLARVDRELSSLDTDATLSLPSPTAF